MAEPFYKLWMFKYAEAWYQSPEEERKRHFAKLQDAYKKAGGKLILACNSA